MDADIEFRLLAAGGENPGAQGHGAMIDPVRTMPGGLQVEKSAIAAVAHSHVVGVKITSRASGRIAKLGKQWVRACHAIGLSFNGSPQARSTTTARRLLRSKRPGRNSIRQGSRTGPVFFYNGRITGLWNSPNLCALAQKIEIDITQLTCAQMRLWEPSAVLVCCCRCDDQAVNRDSRPLRTGHIAYRSSDSACWVRPLWRIRRAR